MQSIATPPKGRNRRLESGANGINNRTGDKSGSDLCNNFHAKDETSIPSTRVVSNREYAISSSYCNEKKPVSAPASVNLSSPVSLHPPDPCKEKAPMAPDFATHIDQAESEEDKSKDTATDILESSRWPQQLEPVLPAPGSRKATTTTEAAEQEAFLLKACRALMEFGAPTHRLEGYLSMSAEALGLHLQSFYMPGCMIMSFNDPGWRSKATHIIRTTQTLDLSKLCDIHTVFLDVIGSKVVIQEAATRIDEVMARGDKFSRWFRVLMYGVASACIGPVSFGARPIDLPVIFLLGSLLGYTQLVLAYNSELSSHLLEILAIIVISFLSRAFGSIPSGPSTSPCFSAICQASLVLILPGFTITNAALELQSKNIVSGSVRMVYGIIYTLFLTFSITIGITIYGAIDSNATSATVCDTKWPFWWQIIFVSPFTLCYLVINKGQYRHAPAMIILSLIGWLVNHFASQRFAANKQIAQTLGALAVGIFANLYSKLGHGLAFVMLHPAIFIQVPGSLAASGSLISGLTSANQVTNNTLNSGDGMTGNGTGYVGGTQANNAVLNAGYSMIEIAIGITIGLSVSMLVVYPFQQMRGKQTSFSF